MEWWIVGQKQGEGASDEEEERSQVEPDLGGATRDLSPTPQLSASSEEDFPPFDPLTGSPVLPPPITPHYWLRYHAATRANDSSSSTSEDDAEWLIVGTQHFYLEEAQLPKGEYWIGRPARTESNQTVTTNKTKLPTRVRPTRLPIASIKAMIKDNVVAQYRQANPKRKRSKARMRYERYKVAHTLKEAIGLGSTIADIRTDVEKIYVTTHATIINNHRVHN